MTSFVFVHRFARRSTWAVSMPPSMTATSTVRAGCLPASRSWIARSELMPGTPSAVSSRSCQLRGASAGGVAARAGAVTGAGAGAGVATVLGAAHAATAAATNIASDEKVFMSWCKSRLNLGAKAFARRLGSVRKPKGPGRLARSALCAHRSALSALRCQPVVVLLDSLAHARIRKAPMRCDHVVDEKPHLLRPRDHARDRRMRCEILEEELRPRRDLELSGP